MTLFNMRTLFKLLFIILIVTIFSACGSKGSSNDPKDTSTNESAYIFTNKIQGISYLTNKLEGTSDANGKISYNSLDKNITFKIGNWEISDFELSRINNDKYILISDLLLIDRNITRDENLLKIIRVLLSLDDDGNYSTSIVIDTNTSNSLTQNISITDTNISILTQFIEDINKTMVTQDIAIQYLEKNLRDNFSIDVDTIAPLTPVLLTNITNTQSNETSVVIQGEVNSKIFINNNSTAYSIDNNGTKTIILTTNANVGDINTFSIILKDYKSNTSPSLDFNITKIDTITPVFTSNSSNSVDENQISAITLVATDMHTVTYSIDGTDANKFDINSSSGVVIFQNTPDYESKNVYSFIAIANDGVNETTQNITIYINDVDEIFPVFTSDSNISVDENQFSTLSLHATDTNTITYYIDGTDADYFDINHTSGVIRFKNTPDYEDKTSYTFIASASDGRNTSHQSITIHINDIDEIAPTFTSNSTVSVDENQLSAITLTASDTNTIEYSISQSDASYFNLNSSTGEVTFKVAPDYENKTSYTFTARADDGLNQSEQNVSINIINLNDNSPMFTSNSTINVDENQPLAITLTASDEDNNDINYSISGTDANSFNVNSSSGEVTFIVSPDYETKNLYSFTAIANDSIHQTEQNITININDIDEIAPNKPTLTTMPDNESSFETVTIEVNGEVNAKVIINDIQEAIIQNNGKVSITLNLHSKTNNFSIRLKDAANNQSEALTFSIYRNDGITSLFINGSNSNILGSYNTNGDTTSIVLSSDGTKAYIADNSEGLKIIDITNINNPSLLGSINTTGFANALVLSSDETKAYIADGTFGLQIIDISNPSTPSLLGHINTDDYASDIKLSADNTKAFIADGTSGLRIIDITNSTNPTTLKYIDTPGSARNLVLSSDETKVYIADYTSGLQIIDISDINHTSILDSVNIQGHTIDLSLSNDENTIFIANETFGLYVIDITSNPPSIIGHINTTNSAIGIKLSNDNTIAYIADGSSGMQIIDISNKYNPNIINTINTPGLAKDITISSNGTKSFVADSSSGLQILSIQNNNPNNISNFITSGFAQDVLVSDDNNTLYLTDDIGLKIIDITNINNPSLLGSLTTTSNAKGIAISNDNNKLYIADGDAGLQIIDMTDKTNPSIISTLDTSGKAMDIALSSDETKAYIADFNTGLVIVDINDSSNPTILNSISTSDEANAIVLSKDNTKAYIANRQSGLSIIDINNTNNLNILGSIDTDDYALDVLLSMDEKTIFLADGNAGLKIININDLSNPTIIGSINTPESAYKLAFSKDYSKLYIADNSSGIQIINITSLNNPTIIGSINTKDQAKSIIVSSDGTKGFVADNKAGLSILDLTASVKFINKDFTSTNLYLYISNTVSRTLNLSVTTNNTNISIGNYDSNLSVDDYKNKTITIPINSINNISGEAIIDISLSIDDEVLTHNKIYFNVYE